MFSLVKNMPSKFRSRSVFVTLWKKFPHQEVLTPELFREHGVNYFHCGAEEKCETSGELHHHVWIQFNKKVTMKTVKALLGQPQCHVERRKGSVDQAINYCDKEKTKTHGCQPVMVWGKLPKQGTRTDLHHMRDHYEDGGKTKQGLLDDSLAHTILRYPAAAKLLKTHFAVQRSEKTDLYIHYGPTGTSKTFLAYEEAKKLGSVYFKPPGKWWDGYEQQDTVIIDDYSSLDSLPLTELFRLAEHYPHQVQVKGGFEQFNSKRIYITSNMHYKNWYYYEPNQLSALERRITKIRHMTEKYGVPKQSITLGTSGHPTSGPLFENKNVSSIEKPTLQKCPARSFNLKTKKIVIKNGGITIADVIDDTDRCQSEETHQSNSPNSDGPTSLHSMPVPTRTQVEQSPYHPAEIPSPCK